MEQESNNKPPAPCAQCGGPGWLASGDWCERCDIGRDLARMARRAPARVPYRTPQPVSDAAGVRAHCILRDMLERGE